MLCRADSLLPLVQNVNNNAGQPRAQSLLDSLISQTLGELICNHRIDPELFVPGAISLGKDEGWRLANERYAERLKDEARNPENGLRPNEVGQKERRITRHVDRYYRETAAEDWNLYSVHSNSKGALKPGLELAGHRVHPKHRKAGDGRPKFDCRGSLIRIYLPPVSWLGAMDRLDIYGFTADPETYEPIQAWEFVLSNPEVPIWVEESALKALAATSAGQLAVGLNGINSAGQKSRPDRLRPMLAQLAKDERPMTVRFDHGEYSRKAAERLSNQLNKAGAKAGWFCWTGGDLPEKTDDYLAEQFRRRYRGQEPLREPMPGKKWEDLRVVGKSKLPHYSRLVGEWPTTTIDREFAAEDIAKARIESRVIALVGATGTGKTTASVAAVELMERVSGSKSVVIGLYHRKSLVHKGAAEFGVRDISAAKRTADREGCNSTRDGLFCCCESIKKPDMEKTLLAMSYDLEENPRDTILFLDEISQSAFHLLVGGTDGMPKIRREAVNAIERLVSNPCVTVITAESGMGDIELAWLQSLSGVKPEVIKSTFTRESVLYVGAPSKANIDHLQSLASEVLQSGKKVWLSMGEATAVERFCKAFENEYKVLAITSANSSDDEVAEFMSDTETVGPKYDLVAYSPSVVSGISLAGTEVGLAACVQQFAMGPEDALQALGRARRAEFRVLLMADAAPMAMIGTHEITFDGVQKAKAKMVTKMDINAYKQLFNSVEKATMVYSLNLEARKNKEAMCNDNVLTSRLKDQGYKLEAIEALFSKFDTAEVIERKRQIVKIVREEEASIKAELLQKLAKGEIDLGTAMTRAKSEAEGGLVIDYERMNPALEWHWYQRLGVEKLVEAGSFDHQSAEFLQLSDRVKMLDKKEARELRTVLGGRITIPGPDDEVKLSFAKAILKLAGLETSRKRFRIGNERTYRYEIK